MAKADKLKAARASPMSSRPNSPAPGPVASTSTLTPTKLKPTNAAPVDKPTMNSKRALLLLDVDLWRVVLRDFPDGLDYLLSHCAPGTIFEGELAKVAKIVLYEARREARDPKRLYLLAKRHYQHIVDALAARGVPAIRIGYCFPGRKPVEHGWLDVKVIRANDTEQLAAHVARIQNDNEPSRPSTPAAVTAVAHTISNVTISGNINPTNSSGLPTPCGLFKLRRAHWLTMLANNTTARPWLNANLTPSGLLNGIFSEFDSTSGQRVVRLWETNHGTPGSRELHVDSALLPTLRVKLAQLGVPESQLTAPYWTLFRAMDRVPDAKLKVFTDAEVLEDYLREDAGTASLATEVSPEPIEVEGAPQSPTSRLIALDKAAPPPPAKLFRLQRSSWAKMLLPFPRARDWLIANLTADGLFNGFFSSIDPDSGKKVLRLWVRKDVSSSRVLLVDGALAEPLKLKLASLGVETNTVAYEFFVKTIAFKAANKPVCKQFEHAEELVKWLRENDATKLYAGKGSAPTITHQQQPPPQTAPISVASAPAPALVSAKQSFTERAIARLAQLPTPPPSHEGSPGPVDNTPDAIKKAKKEAEREQRDIVAGNHKANELEVARQLYERAKAGRGGLSVMAIDVEWWEWNASTLLEFGWSWVELAGRKERREVQHVILKENASRQNKRFAPGARDKFSFGTSLWLSHQACYHTLTALLAHLSADQPLIILFHDSRSDLKALDQLGIPVSSWTTGVAKLDVGKGGAGVYVLDTQRLWSAWTSDKRQVNLGKACEILGIGGAKHLHNAGNDAHVTLKLFECLMDRERVAPKVVSPLTTTTAAAVAK